MSFDYYTEHQQQALEALVQYRYLNPKQLADLGIAASHDAVNKNVVGPLVRRHRAPIEFQEVGRFFGASRVFYLNERGAKAVAEAWKVAPESVPYPPGGMKFGAQYYHRMAQIDFHIRLRQWAESIEAYVAVSDMDFVKGKGEKFASTKVFLRDGGFVIPDALFGFSVDEQPFLYALEVHHKTSPQRVNFKLQNYFKALTEGSISNKYNYQQDAYVLSVFEPERLPHEGRQGKDYAHKRAEERAETNMKSTRRRLMENRFFSSFSHLFLFNTMVNVRADITQGWHHADGSPAHPFG